MIGLQIYIGFNGEPKPVDDINDLRSLYHLLGLYFKSEDGSAPQESFASPVKTNAVPTVETPATVTRALNTAILSDLQRVPKRQPIGETSRDYARRAGLTFDHPVTVREVATKMLELGWPTKAKDSATVKTTARSAMHEAGFTSLEDGLWQPPTAEGEQKSVNGSNTAESGLFSGTSAIDQIHATGEIKPPLR